MSTCAKWLHIYLSVLWYDSVYVVCVWEGGGVASLAGILIAAEL